MQNILVREPVYQQLNEVLKGLMGQRFSDGQKFLTEREVCRQFGVSRATANKALSNMVSEGLLEFKKGVGTFVRSARLDYDLKALVSFTDQARLAGLQPVTHVVAFRTAADGPAADQARQVLSIEAGEPLLYMERRREAGGEPVIFERRHVVSSCCPGLQAQDVAGSLYSLWTDRYGLVIAGADQTIHAVNLSAEEAGQMNRKTGEAALRVDSTGYLADGRSLWWEQTMYRADAYVFQNRLGGLRKPHPAVGVFVSDSGQGAGA